MSDTATADTGGSILTSGLPPPVAAAPKDGADLAIQGVVDGPPEYIPPKFWDAEKKAPKIDELGRSYQNLEKLLGREKVPVPASDDDEEGWSRWYAASGRPDSSDKYEFERPEMPTDLAYDEETEKAFKTWAHANGLNKRQAKSLYEGYVKQQVERHGAYSTHQKQARSQAEQNLRREFGAQYESAVGQAKSALATYADPDYLKYLDETGQGNDPRVIRAWIKVGKEMGGETKIKGNVHPTAQPEDLNKAISDFRAQHEKALFSKEHPDHERRVKEYNKLFEARFGGQ